MSYVPSTRRATPKISQAPEDLKVDPSDLQLIRWMLEKTPSERLRYAQGFANSILRLRGGDRA